MSTFDSFVHVIRKICSTVPVTSVLELGPGTSTRCFVQEAGANVESIETDSYWYEKHKSAFSGEDRVSVSYREPKWDQSEILTTFGGAYDVVFIDGGDRVESLYWCQKLAPGLVLLHDSHRNEYFWGVRRYKYVLPVDRHSAILTDSAEYFAQLARAITPETDHECQYCVSGARKAYFADLLEMYEKSLDSCGIGKVS